MEPNNHDAQLLATHLAEREKLYQHAPFPLYGLPATWVGVRALGEMACTEDDGAGTIDHLGLTHGPHQNDEGTPRLDVITAQPGAGPPPSSSLPTRPVSSYPPAR